MADLQRRIIKGTTSNLIEFQIDATAGGLISTLTFASTGLKAYYYRSGAASAVAISPVTMTVGTWVSGGFAPVDATNMPGVYQLGLPDAALATGAGALFVILFGVTGMNPATIAIELADPTLPRKNTALAAFGFLMLNAAGLPATGLTVTATRSIDGAAFGACANAVTEVSSGFYKLDLAAADLNGTVIDLRFSASGARDTQVTLITNP